MQLSSEPSFIKTVDKSSPVQSSQRYLLYAQAVLQLSFSDQIYSGVQGPLVLTGKDDVGSIEPGHLGHFVINVTPAGHDKNERGEERETDREKLVS